MIEKIVIISLLVFAIHYTMQEDEIFGWLGEWFYKVLPDKLHDPVYDCVVCMCFWYGSIIYWLLWRENIIDWLVTVIAAMGLNAIINQLTPDRE